MRKQETSEAIRRFMEATEGVKNQTFRFEIYKTEDGRLMGYPVDEMSDQQMHRGYDAVWFLARQSTRVLIGSNHPGCTQSDAVLFAKCFVAGKMVTINVDLSQCSVPAKGKRTEGTTW